MKDEAGNYIFHKYIMKIIEKYEMGLIEPDKIQKLLETVERWENQARMLSLAKQRVLVSAMAREK